MQYIYLDDLMRTVLSKPATKVALLDKRQDLWLEGDYKVKAEEYFALTPIGAFAKIKGVTWTPEGQDHPVPVKLGFVSPNEVLFWEVFPCIKGYYHGNQKIAKSTLPFALFALTDEYWEIYIGSTATEGVIHFKWADNQRNILLGSMNDFIDSFSPSLGENFRAFLTDLDSSFDDREYNT